MCSQFYWFFSLNKKDMVLAGIGIAAAIFEMVSSGGNYNISKVLKNNIKIKVLSI